MIRITNISEKSISAKKLQKIERHIAAAEHHQAAAKHHIETAQHIEADNIDEAFDSNMKAHEHSWYAQECEMREQERHALIKSYNNLISRLFI